MPYEKQWGNLGQNRLNSLFGTIKFPIAKNPQIHRLVSSEDYYVIDFPVHINSLNHGEDVSSLREKKSHKTNDRIAHIEIDQITSHLSYSILTQPLHLGAEIDQSDTGTDNLQNTKIKIAAHSQPVETESYFELRQPAEKTTQIDEILSIDISHPLETSLSIHFIKQRKELVEKQKSDISKQIDFILTHLD